MDRYNFGETVWPELPIWYEWSNHPASTTGLEAPIWAFNFSASDFAKGIFSSFDIPLPTETIISAVDKSTPPDDSVNFSPGLIVNSIPDKSIDFSWIELFPWI